MTRGIWKGPYVHPSLLKKVDKLKDKGFIVLCDNSTNIGKTCDENKPKKPAYKITWNRFGNISQYKWSGSGWTIQ